MKTYNRLFLIILVLLIQIPICFSEPPFAPQEITQSEALSIQFPQVEIFKLNENISFNFHVFNTTGKKLIGNEATCEMHIYDNQNAEIIETYLTAVGSDYQYNFTNTSRIGIYSYITLCNTSTLGGFLSAEFKITRTGLQDEDNKPMIALIIFLPLLIGFLIFKISKELSNEMSSLKFGFMILSLICCVVSVGFAYLSIWHYYYFIDLEKGLSALLYSLGIITALTLFVYLMFLLFGENSVIKRMFGLK